MKSQSLSLLLMLMRFTDVCINFNIIKIILLHIINIYESAEKFVIS